MALIERVKGRPQIDLEGPDGNAFALLGYASRFARDLGLNSAEIQKQMTAGDYKHLVSVFEENFGAYVDLILPEGGIGGGS